MIVFCIGTIIFIYINFIIFDRICFIFRFFYIRLYKYLNHVHDFLYYLLKEKYF
jgi:hypothetical protein